MDLHAVHTRSDHDVLECRASHINEPVSGGGEAFEMDDEDARPPLHRVPLEAPRPRLAAAARRLLVAVESLLCIRERGLIRLISAKAMDMPYSAFSARSELRSMASPKSINRELLIIMNVIVFQ